MNKALESLRDVSTAELLSAAGKRLRSLQAEPPTPKKLAPCAHCGVVLGVRERRKHEPECRRGQQSSSLNGALPGRSRDGLEPKLVQIAEPNTADSAREVAERLGLRNPQLPNLLAAIFAEDCKVTVDGLVAAYREYHAARRGQTPAWGAFGFFSENRWRDRNAWLYEEVQPPPRTLPKRATTARSRW
jgi:hypothetical protein